MCAHGHERFVWSMPSLCQSVAHSMQTPHQLSAFRSSPPLKTPTPLLAAAFSSLSPSISSAFRPVAPMHYATPAPPPPLNPHAPACIPSTIRHSKGEASCDQLVDTLRSLLMPHNNIMRSDSPGHSSYCSNDIKDTSPGSSTSSTLGQTTFDGTAVLCQVCGDKASGFHYGVHACEGCKGFFRRSIQQKLTYRPCNKNQQCSILRINRNRCQNCRLRKCIAVGMSRDAVRFGRVPKREKAKMLAEMQRANAKSQAEQVLAHLADQDKVVSTIVSRHMETCQYSRHKLLPILVRFRQLALSHNKATSACPLNSSPSDLCDRFSPAIRGVVDFAQSIPGFEVLPKADQVTLLKAGFFEVLLLRLSVLFDSDTKSLLLLDGSIYRRDEGEHGRFLVDSMFDFVDRFNALQLNDADMAMYCAVVLVSPNRPGLTNEPLVRILHDRLEDSLRKLITVNHPHQPALANQLIMKIPDLTTLNTLHQEKLFSFKVESTIHEKMAVPSESPRLAEPLHISPSHAYKSYDSGQGTLSVVSSDSSVSDPGLSPATNMPTLKRALQAPPLLSKPTMQTLLLARDVGPKRVCIDLQDQPLNLSLKAQPA